MTNKEPLPITDVAPIEESAAGSAAVDAAAVDAAAVDAAAVDSLSGDVPAANAAPDAKVKKRPAPEPVLTLTGYYARRTLGATRFLGDLTKHNRWSFEADDVAEALRQLPDLDPKFVRTAALAAQAVKAKDGRFASPCLEFARVAAEERLADNPRLIANDLAAQPDAEARLRLLALALSGRLEDPKRRAEALNLLLTMTLWLVYSESLDSNVALDQIADTLSVSPDRDRRSGLARVSLLVERGRTGPAGVRPILQLVVPWIERARVAERRAADADEQLAAARAALGDTNERLADRDVELARLRSEIEQANAEVERLVAAKRAAELHGVHDVSQIRASIAGALGGHLNDLIGTVRDALELDPPRVGVAREKIEIAHKELEKQLKWLRSSD